MNLQDNKINLSEQRIVTRKEAQEKGLLRYFTGIPCLHGHCCERFTKSTDCVECRNTLSKAYYHVKSTERVAKFGTYFTGEPCKICKCTTYYSASNTCLDCSRKINQERNITRNPKFMQSKQKAQYAVVGLIFKRKPYEKAKRFGFSSLYWISLIIQRNVQNASSTFTTQYTHEDSLRLLQFIQNNDEDAFQEMVTEKFQEHLLSKNPKDAFLLRSLKFNDPEPLWENFRKIISDAFL